MNQDTIIADPLEWQLQMDNAPATINMRGCSRFWATVQALGINVVGIDGNPDFSRIQFRLTDDVALELSTERGSPYIRYRFVQNSEK